MKHPRTVTERWKTIASLYNDLSTLINEAAKRPKIKAVKLHFRDRAQAKALRGLFAPNSESYKKVNRKVHSPFWKDKSRPRPFLYLRPGAAQALRATLFKFLDPTTYKKMVASK